MRCNKIIGGKVDVSLCKAHVKVVGSMISVLMIFVFDLMQSSLDLFHNAIISLSTIVLNSRDW